jgi:hypothetical protein
MFLGHRRPVPAQPSQCLNLLRQHASLHHLHGQFVLRSSPYHMPSPSPSLSTPTELQDPVASDQVPTSTAAIQAVRKSELASTSSHHAPRAAHPRSQTRYHERHWSSLIDLQPDLMICHTRPHLASVERTRLKAFEPRHNAMLWSASICLAVLPSPLFHFSTVAMEEASCNDTAISCVRSSCGLNAFMLVP